MDGCHNELITLIIENKSLECNKEHLIENSDYFKAMFDGNFLESYQNVISLNDVQFEAVKTILKILWDKEYIIEEKQLLSVLQASCMLQFLQVKDTCVEQVLRILSPSNCLKIWIYTERLDLKDVYCKAKLMALMEYVFVKETSYFKNLTLNEVINYLGNINLQCSDEMDVFESLVNWYQNYKVGNQEILLKLLKCIDFKVITAEEIFDIISNPIIAQHEQICNILNCVITLKTNRDLFNFTENCISCAELFLKSQSRNRSGFPCILVDNIQEDESTVNQTILYCDRFKRKRKYNVLENKTNSNFFAVYLDHNNLLKKFLDIENQKCESVDGFKIIGCKNFIFLFGGEYLLGKGKWQNDFHIYDIIKEKWSKKILEFPRRHFESCICGKYLYVVGGTGTFRVIQENLFYYDMIEDEWSKEIKLPCSGRQIKCCSFQEKLLVLDINNKAAFTFCPDTEKWTRFEICDTARILPFFSKNLVVFSYNNNLYIKENHLLELKLENNEFIILNHFSVSLSETVCHIESVLSNGILYTLSKEFNEEKNEEILTLQAFNIEDRNVWEVCKTHNGILNVENKCFRFKSLNIFNVFHPYSVHKNDLICDF